MSDDIVKRLRQCVTASGGIDIGGPAILLEAANEIEFLRKQSRGHFDALSVVLRDGIEAITPDPSELNPPGPKKAN